MKRSLLFLIVGITLIVTGVLFALFVFPDLLQFVIRKQTSLVNNTEVFNIWRRPPFPVTFKIYVFNVTNPDQVQNGATAIVEELGPYVYDYELQIFLMKTRKPSHSQYWEHVNITMDDNDDTIRYYLKKVNYFNEKESGKRKLEDHVTLINTPLIAIIETVNQTYPNFLPYINHSVPYLFPDAKDIFLRGSVLDFFFNGVAINCSSPSVKLICMGIKIKGSSKFTLHPNRKDLLFSFFADLNNTLDGPYVAKSGLRNNNRGLIRSYKDKTMLDTWKGSECNRIKGTDSSIYGNVVQGDKIYIFSPEICRSIYVDYERDVFTFGITTYRFSITNEPLANSKQNSCFCSNMFDENMNDTNSCYGDGFQDLTPCLHAPIVMSLPHFYLSDGHHFNGSGVSDPSKELHESFAEIEPLTGVPLKGAKRIQFNSFLNEIRGIDLLENVTDSLVPILWIEEILDFPDNIVDHLRIQLLMLSLSGFIRWFISSLGCCMCIISVYLMVKKEKPNPLNSIDLNSDTNISRETLSTYTTNSLTALKPVA